jgi:hypothetical protein
VPSQSVETARVAPFVRAENSVAIGPGPLRTARGGLRFDFEERRRDDLRRAWLPDDRVFEEAEPEPLLFRDAGGEDVRVAMVRRLCECPTRHTLHTPDRSRGSLRTISERVSGVSGLGGQLRNVMVSRVRPVMTMD